MAHPGGVSIELVRSIVALLFLVVVGASTPPLALAQQGVSEPYQVAAGPYNIAIITNQSSLSLGSVQFRIVVRRADNNLPVSDARVLVRARHEPDDLEGWATALNSPRSPELYEGQIVLDRPGKWLMSVEVTSPQGQVEVESPSLVVPEPRSSRAGGLVFAGVFIMLVLGVGYLTWSIRRIQQKRRAAGGP